ncbi:MAG: hypothetical protein O7G83_12870 [Proteobacteria bacterium]|nr:hypothetical protein [Pseudomonadota bacterium]
MRALFFAALLSLSACGESTEEAYERGYETGWMDICDEIAQFSSRMEAALEREKIC